VRSGSRRSQGTLGGGEVPDPVRLEHGWAAAGSLQEEPRHPAGTDRRGQHGLHRGETQPRIAASAGGGNHGLTTLPGQNLELRGAWSAPLLLLPFPAQAAGFTDPLANPVGWAGGQERKRNKA